MKISYNPQTGEILAASKDDVELAGQIILIPDDEKIFHSITKYKVDPTTKEIKQKPYLKLSTTAKDTNNNGIPDVPINTEMQILIEKYKSDDTLDAMATNKIEIRNLGDLIPSQQILNLVNGRASFTVKSNFQGIYSIMCSALKDANDLDDIYPGFLTIEIL